ncbi:ubiquinol-cytochrome C chaperone family protein [Chelatococcus asaccharovorans]|uniref:Cytochrome b pre-mRNA-processing protein 3 n=1 Tax=Chelatococcus asaccharovorans TaxID=28210 RepID=A0A2V3U662_9HYPH|nr:ubiquinol-cytochrome C chaperone family protein [Chelatococcus asaccharovorans]MBS7703817.1 ubiquinol-cytochrome C chaperone [Chelatococcus asaccharovorans]PXW57978.1 cytochrome b pre-mRNA-processing protein 3 [Chelatococcus asaccharovorans]
MILKLFRSRPRDDVAASLFERVNAAARAPQLYRDGWVVDTVEGRFELLTLHAVLLLRRLRALPAPAPDLAQEFVDRLFLEIERAFREIGIGDLAVPKRMKAYAKAFYGRAASYDEALAEKDNVALCAAVERNLGVPGADVQIELALYMRAVERHLAALEFAEIVSSTSLFPDLRTVLK